VSIETEKISHVSADVAAERSEQLKVLFPEAFTEGKVDFDKLRMALGDLTDERPERYSFTWAGKRDSIRLLQTPSEATLEPAPDESVNFGASQHLFIEGDNLEVLKLLHKSYFGRVKMIYIDPPYNTGNDFVYPDNFKDPLETYLHLTGQKDANGNLLTSNAETSGRYHSAWLSMMYPRLFLARQLLRDDGVIFVSIDDHEVHNLRLLMNEIFGEENFIANIIWKKRSGPPNDKIIGSVHEYIIVYARSQSEADLALLPRTEASLARYTNPDNDPRGDWVAGDISANAKGGRFVPSLYYEITNPTTGQKHLPPEGACWRFSKDKVEALIKDNRIVFGSNGEGRPKLKRFASEVRAGLTVPTLWDDVGTNTTARSEINDIFGSNSTFETPKPVSLIKRMLEIAADSDGIFLDFFAGSGTTAQAVLELNREDGGNRRFICVQLPEPTGGAEYSTIAAISRERIRRVIAKMQAAQNGTLDVSTRATPEDLGFKAFKLTSSNFRQWQNLPPDVDADEYARQMELFNEPLLEGWTPQDVIYEVALKEGYSLTSRIEPVPTAENSEIWRVTDDDKGQHFHIGLSDSVSLENIQTLGLGQDDVFICRGSALNDTAAANLALQCRLKML
jgi:adenine-specific DNA-methyltransferase